jgi:comEA protein
MLGLTKDEKLVIVFLSISLAAGSLLLLYKRFHPSFATGLLRSDKVLPAPLTDTLFSEASDSLLSQEPAAVRTEKIGPARVPLAPVNINTAGQKTLEALPHIGPSMAKRIIEYRSASGGFTNIEQLGRVKGIGPKRLEQLRQHVTVDR